MMVIDNKYEIGDIVYLKTDTYQDPHIIIALCVFKAGEVLYRLMKGTSDSEHYEFELSDQVNEELKIKNL